MRRAIPFGVLTLLGVAVAVYFAWYPRLDTAYAPGFSAAKFRSLRAGATMGEVRSLLGEPVSVTRQTQPEVWSYGFPYWEMASLSSEKGLVLSGGTLRIDDYPAVRPDVYFDDAGRVAGAPSWAPFSNAHKGDGKDDVLKVLGPPCMIVNADSFTYWNYSGPRSKDSNYERWSLRFSATGRLVGKYFEVLYD